MPNPNALPQGQIVPVARPVSAFIQPSQVNIAAPAQLVQMPDPTGINTIGIGATPNVQGANNLAETAASLSAFNKQLIPAMQSAGLAYAASRAQAGELAYQKAREQMLRATAANDASMETAQLDRAAASRNLATKDPQAGQWMAMLDPYMKVGWERGKAKLAAQQIAIGMDGYISQNAQIDYTAPDQGFSGLVKARAEYVAQVAQEYGISETSPGFQKYTAPAIEQAAEKAALKLVADRKKYFDTTAVSQGASQLRGIYAAAVKDKQVELNGQIYPMSGDEQTTKLFWSALAIKASTLIEQTAMAGTLPGDATERSKGIFEALAGEANYTNDKNYRYFVEAIPSNEFRRGANGKPLISPNTGQPLRMTWGELYRQESIDSEIKYGQAGFANRKRVKEEALEGVGGFEEGLLQATQGLPPGPARQAAADQYVGTWYNQYGRLGGVSLSELQKRRKTVMELNSSLYFEGTDTGAAPSFFQELSETQGSAFNPAAWRKRIQQDASRIKDPAEQLTFIKSATAAVADKERDKASFTGYNAARDKVIGVTIKANLDKYYGAESSRNEVDRNESLRRQTSAFAPFVNSRINDAEARLKRKLTDSEVRSITTQALEEYGTKGQDGKDQKEYLFPGSRFTNIPSVSPRLKPGLNQGIPPAAKQSNAYKGATYEIADLDKVPDRKIKLQNFRNEPVLSADSIEDLIDAVTDGKDWPMKFERAWRDAGAKSGGEFIFEHIDNYYPGLFQLPATLRQKIQKRAAVQAGAGDYMVAHSRIQAEMPGLSSLSGWALQALIGA